MPQVGLLANLSLFDPVYSAFMELQISWDANITCVVWPLWLLLNLSLVHTRVLHTRVRDTRMFYFITLQFVNSPFKCLIPLLQCSDLSRLLSPALGYNEKAWWHQSAEPFLMKVEHFFDLGVHIDGLLLYATHNFFARQGIGCAEYLDTSYALLSLH